MKLCNRCKEVKEESAFGVDRSKKDGLHASCRSCRRTGVERAQYHLLSKYQLSLTAYAKIFASQNGQCAVCGTEATSHTALVVDHCHKTGKVRGLLCSKCNSGLGFFKDDIFALKGAITYLSKFAVIDGTVSQQK